MARRLSAGTAAVCCATAAAAGDPPQTEVGLSHGRETISTHPAAWSDSQLQVLHRFAPHKMMFGRATSSERFGLHDNTLALGGVHPLGERSSGYVEVSASDTHRVLPRHSMHVQLAQSLSHGWGVLGGLKHVAYNTTAVDVGELTVERYFTHYRAAFSAYPSQSSTAGSAASYRLQLSRYYGEENNVQILYATGTEVDRPTTADSIVTASIRSVALFGRHWMTRDWALSYSVARTALGDSRRQAAVLGLHYRF